MSSQIEKIEQGLKRRYLKEFLFRLIGRFSVFLVVLFLVFLFFQIAWRGFPAFISSSVTLPIKLQSEGTTSKGAREAVRAALDFSFGEQVDKNAQRILLKLLSTEAFEYIIKKAKTSSPQQGRLQDLSLLLGTDADLYLKGALPKKQKRFGLGMVVPNKTVGTIEIFSTTSSEFAFLSEIKNKQKTEVPFFLYLNDGVVKIEEITPQTVKGTVLVPLTSLAPVPKQRWSIAVFDTPETDRKLKDKEIAWLDTLEARGLIQRHVNFHFLTNTDSREPERAGIWGGIVGSFLMMLVTLSLCVPTGVAAAIYLEEFAPKNRWTDWIEVNIQNLAAVPSIIFGLLGLSVLLNVFEMPRSSALVGGTVLALLVLPTIIVTSRSALKAVPPSIKEAALAIGASHQQAVFHHVLPLAIPGMMTGTIIGMAHALGETAPLLMIGMVAFIVDIPHGIFDAASALPVQIFLWSDLPEPAFQEKTAAAIIVLLFFLFFMNAGAIFLRKYFERRW